MGYFSRISFTDGDYDRESDNTKFLKKELIEAIGDYSKYSKADLELMDLKSLRGIYANAMKQRKAVIEKYKSMMPSRDNENINTEDNQKLGR